MKTKLILLVLMIFGLSNFIQAQNEKNKKSNSENNYKVTFYELGSVRCIPCKQMQPILKSIEEKYKVQVNVIFYDVWTKEGKESAKNFTFDAIPTQIFVDQNGKEFFRHVGYFSEEEITKILNQIRSKFKKIK